MNTTAKERLIYTGAAAFALIVGVAVAQQMWVLLAALLVFSAFSVASFLAPQKTHTVLFAVLLAGYMLGNRGFAQLSPVGSIPLFPAELGLALSGSLMLWQCTVRRELPFSNTGLDRCLLFWIAASSLRFPLDFRSFGFLAIRDFALVYYAAFFFLAQTVFLRVPDPSRWLHRVLLAASLPLVPLLFLFDHFPAFFLEQLTFRGVPLIYFKGDLAVLSVAIGCVAWFVHFEQDRRRWLSLALSLVMAARVLTSDSRSAVLALLCAALWLGFGGRRALLKILVFGGLAGALVLFCFSLAAGKRWEETALRNAYEKVVSLTDFSGRRDYYGEGSSSKGDNNRFRAVWWKSILAETYQKNPYIGLGFGYDLADEFLKTYYPEGNDEFNVRSPHNIFVTLFARTGAVGLLAFLCFLAANGLATLRATRQREKPEEALPWCCAWAILASACFGVVLEGPMGAVPYWIFLGIGSAALIKREYEPASPMPAEVKALAS